MGLLDPPALSRATADHRYPLRRRVTPPLVAAKAPLSSETFSGAGVAFTTTLPTFTNSRNLTGLSGVDDALNYMGLWGAVMVRNGTVSTLENRINGSATRASYGLGVSHYGQHIAFKFRTFTTTAAYHVFVDGKPLTADPVSLTALTAGTLYYLDLPFASVAERQIVVYTTFLDSQGYRVEQAGGYGAYDPPAFRLLIMGDSWIEGTTPPLSCGAWPMLAGRTLGTNTFVAGQGGTGYTNNNGASGGKTVYASADRLAGVAAVNPDLIVISGSINDQSSSGAAVQAAATSAYAALATQFPGVPVIVLGVQSVSTGAGFSTAYDTANTAVAAAAAAAPNVIGFVNHRAVQWITGSGNSAAPGANGNADTFLGSDFVHLTAAGTKYWASRSASAIRSLAFGS